MACLRLSGRSAKGSTFVVSLSLLIFSLAWSTVKPSKPKSLRIPIESASLSAGSVSGSPSSSQLSRLSVPTSGSEISGSAGGVESSTVVESGSVELGSSGVSTVGSSVVGSTTGSTTGSVSNGEWFTLIDSASGVWSVSGFTASTGTEATPFSSAVS